MASIKVKFHPSNVADQEGIIYYQIIHDRKPRQLRTDYRVFPSEWDERASMVVTPQKSRRKSLILTIKKGIRCDLERITKIIRNLSDKGVAFTVDEIIGEFNRYSSDYTLCNYMESIIIRLRQNGKIRTSETYTVTLNSFRKFLRDSNQRGRSNGVKDIMLDCIDSETMEAYEAWQRQRGVTPNTVSFYTRILRAVYNRAVENGIIDDRNPFRHVYTGVDKTVKRALPLTVIKKIRGLDLTLTPALDYSRDMFIMSFMLRGMSFIDMAYLRKSDLSNGYIAYRRRKTGQLLSIKWTKEMQKILDKYPENCTDYLLPIIKNIGTNERYVYRNAGYNINRNLKKIAKKIGISIPLTLYVARHSWASAARLKGVPVSVISEGMGHDSETTTQIYLASLDTTAVDRANSLILSSL